MVAVEPSQGVEILVPITIAEGDMARNKIQFGKGLELTTFQKRFGTEEACREAVIAWRWPDGFKCPACGGAKHAIVGKRQLYLCHSCRRQTSPIAGTVFENTMIPLVKWFQAMWLITQSKNSISTLEMSRQIGVKWDTAWRLRQKLATIMEELESGRVFVGRIEIDDAVLGGEKSLVDGGKRGRSGANKVPFVAAVETSAQGRPRRLLLHLVERCSRQSQNGHRRHSQGDQASLRQALFRRVSVSL